MRRMGYWMSPNRICGMMTIKLSIVVGLGEDGVLGDHEV